MNRHNIDYFEKHTSLHLPKKKQIQLGSYYTPRILVQIVNKFIKPYIKGKKNVIIFDNAAGCGAFASSVEGNDYRFADYDSTACDFLKKEFDSKKVFYSNSLIGVNRKKYNIPEETFLIQVGNPPYNDTTSEFKSGEKGTNTCDPDLFDRDLGVSFLKSYDKLKSDVVCILHPLSYLIKETNFKRLKKFRENYKLKNAVIFSSSLFDGTGTIKFPIIVGLYERSLGGMNYDSIRNFKFSVLNSSVQFVLDRYETSDGYINKYPPNKRDIKLSPIGLYYYTFRDLNSLRKNTSFLNRVIPNGIVVSVENFYKYAYLYALKTLFKVENIWLYGNLSPLARKEIIEENKKLFIDYAFRANPIIKELDKQALNDIAEYYKVSINKRHDLTELESSIKAVFNNLL